MKRTVRLKQVTLRKSRGKIDVVDVYVRLKKNDGAGPIASLVCNLMDSRVSWCTLNEKRKRQHKVSKCTRKYSLGHAMPLLRLKRHLVILMLSNC